MSRPNEEPSWTDDDDPSKITEPSPTKKLAGFIYKERPAFDYINWLFRNLVKWVLHIDLSSNQFDPHEASTPDMTVEITAGKVQNGTTLTSIAAQATATITAPSVNPRIDRIVIDNATGVITIIAGAEAGSPVAPDLTIGKIAIAQVLLQTSTTEITNSMITDERASYADTPSFDVTELSSALTRIEVTSLDFEAGEPIEAEGYLIATGAANFYIELNQDATATNYYKATDRDGVAVVKANNNLFGPTMAANDEYSFKIFIHPNETTGETLVTTIGTHWDDSASEMITFQSAHKYTSTDVITSIGLFANGSTFKIGSKLRVK